MSRHRRMYFYNGVYHVTTRTSEGLPFISAMLMKLILFGIIARAKSLHPKVKICAWLFMGNHFHAILVNKGSAYVIPDFMEFVNGEIAKAINRLRGRRNFTVWATRYKAEQILTADSVIDCFVYLFMNPVRANLVSSIRDYPGASTWREFLGHPARSYQYFNSCLLSRLPKGAISLSLSKKIILSYRRKAKTRNVILSAQELTIEPFAWLECFAESSEWTASAARERILGELSEKEKVANRERAKSEPKDKTSLLGKAMLMGQCFYKKYISANYSPRSLCKSTCPEMRAAFKVLYQEFCEKCHKCWLESKQGLLDIEYPPGAYQPCRPANGSLLQFNFQY